MFSDENVFRLIFYPISTAATDGTCGGLWCTGCRFPVSFNSSYLELPSESVIFIELFPHIGYRWIKELLYAQQNLLRNTYCCFYTTEISFISGGREVLKLEGNFTSIGFWLHKMHCEHSNDDGIIHTGHTVGLGICGYLIFPSCEIDMHELNPH